MQRIDLAKYEELLGLEEKVLEQGLELSTYAPFGKGKGFLSKNLNKQLPYLFYDFQKIELIDQKIEKLKDNIKNKKPRGEYFINGRSRTKTAIGVGETAAYAIPILIANNLKTYLLPLAIWAMIGTLMAPVIHPCIGPTSCAKALADKTTYKTRKKHSLKKAERKKAKLQKGIKMKIGLANAGRLKYTDEWLKKEKEGLEEMLVSANPEFAEGFTELQKIIRPEHQLELYKHFEEFVKHAKPGKWNKERVDQHLERLKIAKGSGLWAQETKESFIKELQEREKSFERLLKPLENLPKNPKMAKMAEQIERAASLEHYLQKYPRISKERKELLRQFYKQRPELAWTARGGRLDIITRDRRVIDMLTGNRLIKWREMYTTRQSIGNILSIISMTEVTFYAMLAVLTANPVPYAILGAFLGLGQLGNIIARKDNNAEMEIRNHLRAREQEQNN